MYLAKSRGRANYQFFDRSVVQTACTSWLSSTSAS
jgi:hypothetical protein